MRNSPLPRMSRRGRVTVGVLVGVFILFTLLGWGIDAYTDYLWFSEVDFTAVFSGVLLTKLTLFLVIGALMTLSSAGIEVKKPGAGNPWIKGTDMAKVMAIRAFRCRSRSRCIGR